MGYIKPKVIWWWTCTFAIMFAVGIVLSLAFDFLAVSWEVVGHIAQGSDYDLKSIIEVYYDEQANR